MHLKILENNYIPLLEWFWLNFILIPAAIFFRGRRSRSRSRSPAPRKDKDKEKKRTSSTRGRSPVKSSKPSKGKNKAKGDQGKASAKNATEKGNRRRSRSSSRWKNPRVNFYFLSAIFLGVWHLQTADLNYIVFSFPLPRGNRKQSNLSDIQRHFGLNVSLHDCSL